jgi:hypothetical protein
VCSGEAIGSYLPWAPVFRPALPPPEVDLEAAHASIARIRALRPSTLLTSHFGPVPDPAGALTTAEDRIDAWASDVRDVLEADPEADVATITARLAERARADFARDAGTPIDEARYDVLGSIRMNAQGLARYWRTRRERERGRA